MGDVQCRASSAMLPRAHARYPNSSGLLGLHAEVENLLGLAALIFLEGVRIVQRSWVAHDREALGGDAQARFVERQDHVCVGIEAGKVQRHDLPGGSACGTDTGRVQPWEIRL